MHHVLGDFANGSHPGVHEHIGLAVIGFPGRQKLANLGEWVGFD
jgi:hypothetical protein